MNLDPLLREVPGAVAADDFGTVSVDVPAAAWHAAVRAARDGLGCTFLDFLSAVDEGDEVRVVCHVLRLDPFGHVLLRALLDGRDPVVATVEDLYAGAAWHERETAEMFGVSFVDEAGAAVRREHLLLREGFPGHPLRKSFALEARTSRPWPGEKEPGR